MHPFPVSSPLDWAAWMNASMMEAEVKALRVSVNWGTPFGADSWVSQIVRRLGLEATFNPRGRTTHKEVECPLCSRSKDNAPISIDFLIYSRVLDPIASVVQVQDFAGASQRIAITTLRAIVAWIKDDLRSKQIL